MIQPPSSLTPADDRRILKTLDKGLLLLDTIRQCPEPITLTELQALFPTDSGSLHRLIITLVRRKYLIQHYRTKRYSIGPKGIMLNLAFFHQNHIIRLAANRLLDLSSSFPEKTASIAVNSGYDAAMVVLEAVRERLVHDSRSIGKEIPYHATAHGKALLAFQPTELQQTILRNLPLESATSQAVPSINVLQKELNQIRNRGWAVECGDWIPGITGIAVPVLDPINRAVAAFGLHWSGQQQPTRKMIQTLQSIAKATSTDL